MNRYYDPAWMQFLSVDPDVAQTGEPYAFVGDDPLNLIDPLGLHGWTWHDNAWHWYIGNLYASDNAGYYRMLAYNRDRSGHYDWGHAVVNVADQVRHQVAAHPVATFGLVLGTVSLAIPGAEELGVEQDESSLAAFRSGSELKPTSILQNLKTGTGYGAVVADAEECEKGSAQSCVATAFGLNSVLIPGDVPDEPAGWSISTYKYLREP